MSASTQNGSGIGYWLEEEMKLWHSIPVFLLMALAGWGLAVVVGLFIPTEPILAERMIGGAALFAGVLTGWTARRYKEEGKLG